MMSRQKEVQLRKDLAKAKRLMRQEDLDRRKHWGAHTRIEEYQDAVMENVDLKPLEDVLDGFSQESLVSEDLFDRIAQSINFQNLFKAAMVEQLQEVLVKSYKQGGSRVLTVDGESLDVAFDVDPKRITDQLESQEFYLKNLAEDARKRTKQIVIQGTEEGKSIGEMKDEIIEGVEDMTEHRAETIARTEVIDASNSGTREAIEKSGFDKVAVDASVDRQTCEAGTFDVTIGGEQYTSCREWDGEVFETNDAPQIPRESHANCRCAILVTTD